jgi:hypothetical protein
MGEFSLMRPRVPALLLSMLIILSAVAALISLQNSPRIAYFSQPKPGSARVLRSFLGAVKSTLDAPSFLFHGLQGAIEYRAPGRTRGLSPFDNDETVIGQMFYVSLGTTNGVVSGWGEEPLTPTINQEFGPEYVKFELTDLLEIKSVHMHNGLFVAEQVVPANAVTLNSAGQALVFWIVKIDNGHVTRIQGRAHGIFQSYALAGRAHNNTLTIKPVIKKSLPTGNVTFSQFGAIPEILPPAKSKTVKLVPCQNGDIAQVGPKYVCGTFGT